MAYFKIARRNGIQRGCIFPPEIKSLSTVQPGILLLSKLWYDDEMETF